MFNTIQVPRKVLDHVKHLIAWQALQPTWGDDDCVLLSNLEVAHMAATRVGTDVFGEWASTHKLTHLIMAFGRPRFILTAFEPNPCNDDDEIYVDLVAEYVENNDVVQTAWLVESVGTPMEEEACFCSTLEGLTVVCNQIMLNIDPTAFVFEVPQTEASMAKFLEDNGFQLHTITMA